MLRVDVPPEPFRFRITGQDTDGRPFTSVFPRLFRPAEGTIRPLEYPAGLPAQQRRLIESMLDTATAAMQSLFEASIARGAIRIARCAVSEAGAHEPLLAPLGNRIGMRVRFVVRFVQGGVYSLTPHVYPEYQDSVGAARSA